MKLLLSFNEHIDVILATLVFGWAGKISKKFEIPRYLINEKSYEIVKVARMLVVDACKRK